MAMVPMVVRGRMGPVPTQTAAGEEAVVVGPEMAARGVEMGDLGS